MAKNLTQYSVLLSSPGDLHIERNEIPTVINELNQTYGKYNNLYIDLIKWETNSAPGITHEYTQQLINKDIGDNYDIFIGIIWKKFGTKTESAESGTEEEYLRALERFKNGENIQILFYFKLESIPINEIVPEEIVKINNFKNKLKENNVLFWSFNTVEELKNQLRLHIPMRMDGIIQNLELPEKKLQISNKKEDKLQDEELLGYLDFSIQFDEHLSSTTQCLNNISDATRIVADELSKKSNEINKLSKTVNFKKTMLASVLTRTAKSIDEYTERVNFEGNIYAENFESLLEVGSGYLNTITKENISQHVLDLQEILLKTAPLIDSIPSTIDSIQGFYDQMKVIPSLYSVFNKSKNKLLRQLDDFIIAMKNSYDLTSEFQKQIIYKLSWI